MLRDVYYGFRNIKKTPAQAFNLENELKSEMTKAYKLFNIRRYINKKWVQLTLSKNMDGDLMYFLAKRDD